MNDVGDARLEWLETTFLDYIARLKSESHPDNFFSKETSHALVLMTISNVKCMCFLLREKINLVLTQTFSGDPIEALFGFLRGMAGCNDAMDVKKCSAGLKKC